MEILMLEHPVLMTLLSFAIGLKFIFDICLFFYIFTSRFII